MPNFQPQVNYNVPILQHQAPREIQRPDINVQTIDIGHTLKYFGAAAEKRKAAEEGQAYERLKSEYASKFDEIDASLSQGVINTNEADLLKRSISEEGRLRGITIEDDIKLRKNYGGPIEGLEKNRLEMIVKEQQEVLEGQRKDIRDRFPQLRFADNNTIDSITHYVDSFGRDKDYYNNIINNPYSSEAERESAMLHLQDTVNEEAFFNTNMIAQQYMDSVANSKEIDPNFRESFLEGTTQEMIRNGTDITVARLAAERLWDKTGLSTFYRLHEVDAEEATKFAKTIADNYESTLKQNGLKGLYDYSERHPGFAAIMQLPQGMQQNLPRKAVEDVMNNFTTYESTVVKGKGIFGGMRTARKLVWTGETGKAAIQSFNISLADPNATTESIVGQRGATAKAFNDYTNEQGLMNMSQEDLAVTRDNARTLSEQLDSAPAKNVVNKALNGKSRDNAVLAEDSNKQLRATKGIENAANILINVEGPTKNLIKDSTQADRLRYDDKGELVLVKDATYLQKVTQFFNNPKYYLDSINNNAAKSMTADERKDAYAAMGIKQLQPGEAAAEFSDSTHVRLMKGIENFVNSPTTSMDVMEERAGKLNRMWGGEVDQTPEERLNAAKNDPNISDEEYVRMEQDYINSLMSDEETTISSKVSNKSTLGGASLVNDDREMAIAPTSEEHVRMMEEAAAEADPANYEGANEDMPYAEKVKLLQWLEDEIRKDPELAKERIKYRAKQRKKK